ncbi:MAG TPA: hypothetical protein DF613_16080 [Lachnospiraceae bacterium]|nr:hypothetical protein [Lachnospiraceae bacterium]
MTAGPSFFVSICAPKCRRQEFLMPFWAVVYYSGNYGGNQGENPRKLSIFGRIKAKKIYSFLKRMQHFLRYNIMKGIRGRWMR